VDTARRASQRVAATKSGGMPTACPDPVRPYRGVVAPERSEADGFLQGCRHAPSTSPFGFSGCHPTILCPPFDRHPDRRAQGPEWRDRFEQPFHKAPDALPQLHQRNRCAMLKNGFLGFAVLCYAPHRFARNDDDGATRTPARRVACPGDAGGRSSSHGHALRGHATHPTHAARPRTG